MKIFSIFNENRMLIPLYDHMQWHSYKIRSVLVWISNRVVIVKRQKKKSQKMIRYVEQIPKVE